MKHKVVIFDFDGTLADVEAIIRQLYGEIAPKRRWPELTDEAYQTLRRGTLREAMRWLGVRPWQLPGLMRVGRTLFHKHSASVQLFVGIPELVEQLHEDGWHIYVLSNNSVVTIHEILERNNVDHYVHVLKRPALFGKAASINKLIKQRRYDRNNVWMIGDEVRDIQAANKARVKSIAVSWGLQDESVLQKTRPTHLAHDVTEIKKLLDKEH